MTLRRHPDNPRYFCDRAGRLVFLTGSHHWDVLLDILQDAERPGFDFEGYLDRLVSWGHSFVRLWTHEAWTREVRPLPYPRTGPGTALDGGPRFDLSRFDPEYFERLRHRVIRIGERGLYAGVMLFNGWSIHDKGEGNPWSRHPFNRRNNADGIDGDPDALGHGADVHTLRVPAITRLQEAYVERVVATVGDQEHVLWEISNESPGSSRDWQAHLIRHLRACDPAGHPIGMTAFFPGGDNEALFRSEADWISPSSHGGWKRSPPVLDGGKVVLVDTDHLWGIGGDRAWVWKTFLRGHQPIYMDPLDDDPVREDARRAMGVVRRLAERIDLARMTPDSDGYTLRSEDETLLYLPRGRGRADLAGELDAEWIHPVTGEITAARLTGGRRLRAPFPGDAVVRLARAPAPGGSPPPPAPSGRSPRA